MSTRVVRIPVVCPKCGHECLMSMPVATVAAGLVNGPLELQAGCHHSAWKATDIEREQIRAYLSVHMLAEAQEGSLAKDLSFLSFGRFDAEDRR